MHSTLVIILVISKNNGDTKDFPRIKSGFIRTKLEIFLNERGDFLRIIVIVFYDLTALDLLFLLFYFFIFLFFGGFLLCFFIAIFIFIFIYFLTHDLPCLWLLVS